MQDEKNKNYWIEEENLEWYLRQFKEPYRITVAFKKFLDKNINISKERILDIGCGAGSALDYIAKSYKNAKFMGLDINPELFKMYMGDAENITFRGGDCYNLDRELVNQFEGVISLQTLSWLPEYNRPLSEICKLNPKWIAVSSLFYPGKINFTISMENYERPVGDKKFSQVYYNVYSVVLIKEMLKSLGYSNFIYEQFEIDIDINQPDKYDLGYYTINTDNGKRLAFNTCLYQPEGFIFASR